MDTAKGKGEGNDGVMGYGTYSDVTLAEAMFIKGLAERETGIPVIKVVPAYRDIVVVAQGEGVMLQPISLFGRIHMAVLPSPEGGIAYYRRDQYLALVS